MDTLFAIDFYTYLAFGTYLIATYNFYRNNQYTGFFVFAFIPAFYAVLQITGRIGSADLSVPWGLFNVAIGAVVMYQSNKLNYARRH